jgi:amino acid adenylation domain-containing protein
MVPARFLVLERWPLTSHGKVDRRALAALETQPIAADAETDTDAIDAAPSSPIEELVRGFFRTLLGIEHVRPSDDFFALGGHSLLAMRLLSRIHDTLHVQLPLRVLFEAPTPAALVRHIEAVLRDGQAAAPPLCAVPHDGLAPMSFAQQRLWFLDRLEPGGTLYNMAGGYRLRGELDRAALGAALTALVARHEVLRTRLTVVEGVPVQRIAPPAPHPLQVTDLRACPADARDAALHAAIDSEAATPFDLAAGPLLRTTLIALADDDHVLVLAMHHAIGDGWSVGVLLDDLTALYTAEVTHAPAQLPALAVQYADYARWQRAWLSSDAIDTQLAYWKGRLAGQLPVLQLPSAQRRPPVQTFRGDSVDFVVPPALASALRELGQRQGTTLFMVLMAAYQVLLHRYSGEDDILVGTPMAGRGRSETEALIGLFLNTVVIRSDLSHDPSFRALLGRVREATLEAWAHQDVPFEKLVEELNPGRSLSHAPLFQVMFVLLNTPAARGQLPGMVTEPFPLRDRSAKFDLTLTMEEQGPCIRGSLQYNVDLFDAATITHMVGHLLVLLEGIVREPDTQVTRFPLATLAERQAVQRINATEMAYPHDHTLDQLFAAQAERQPDATAVISGGHRLSYAALRRQSHQLGHRLRRMGARPNTAIAVVMEKGWEQIVAMLGIHAAGSAYLPIDPGIPHDRLAYILEHAQVEVVVTQPALADRLAWPAHVQHVLVSDAELAGEPDAPLAPHHTPDDLAYILYTSGSTGRPKGVALGHRGAVNTVCEINRRFHVTPADRVIAMSATTFDLSVYDVFGTLAAGAAIVIPDARSMRDPAHWLALVRDEQVSIWSSVPAYIQMLVALVETQPGTPLASLRVIALSGDVLPVGLPDRVRAQLGPIEIVNLGGNTEASIWSVIYPVDVVDPRWQSVPYGHPLANQRCYVLNPQLVACPTSVPGDLYFAGLGLAHAYWRDDEKTRAYFITHPETGERIYRTGDLAYWRADGELILLGRSDFQVKVQGFRIEPGEIELALKKHAAVREAVVIARDGGAGPRGDKRLVAYVVAQPGAPAPATAELRKFLAEWLPDYMIPSVFMAVADLPLSANGKLDRKALPEPDATAALAVDHFVAPRTPLEHTAAALWCEVLELPRVGIHDNFFELGGHSLLATQLVARLPAALGVELPLRMIFESPTIAEMCVAVAQQLASHKDDAHLARLLSELEGLSDAEAEDRLTHTVTPEG